ncbi:alpha-(1,3)-fucosyltransferase 10-like isoform X2 [Mya arenaria]|nr:alpha-(1,3)-fucosyltransferase 10-like isoform X2 [Mya arenaria]
MLWWDSVYTSVDDFRQCGQITCRVTNNRTLQNHMDTRMFIFYGSHFKPYGLPFPRKQNHLWALLHEESPRNAYILSHEPTLTYFNFTSSYNQRSDYPIATQWLQCPDWLQDKEFLLPLVDKNRLRKSGLAPILYLQSDCDVPSDRDTFVELLKKYIPVDSYGACGHNKDMPKRLRFENSMAPLDEREFFQFAARYKFTLAMENYVCEDYVTEKLWRPFRLGSVPIVFGAPNVKEYLPSNKSAILVEDFEDIKDLAEYVKLLDKNNILYNDYLRFKEQPTSNTKLKKLLKDRDWVPDYCKRKHRSPFQRLKQTQKQEGLTHSSLFIGFECFLCNQIHKIEKQVYSDEIGMQFDSHVATSDQYYCPSPRMFDENGHYSVHDEKWSSEWTFGKYEAMALKKLYDAQTTSSEREFSNLALTMLDEEAHGDDY